MVFENGDQYSVSEWVSVIDPDLKMRLFASLPTLILMWKKLDLSPILLDSITEKGRKLKILN